MSEPIRIESAEQIRQGDLIRIEAAEGERRPVRAVEYTALRDKYVPTMWEDTFWPSLEGIQDRRRVFLLDRQIELPTWPWSMVVPPEGVWAYPVLLVPNSDSECHWTHECALVTAEHVIGKIRKGWRVIPGPETNEDTTKEAAK